MTERASIVPLSDRGVVSVSGADAEKLLQGLVTNDLGGLAADPEQMAFDAEARHAGLLSPQGKILFEFFCVRTPEGFVLDVLLEKAAELVKRLTMYKLRAAAEIKDASGQFKCLALWGPDAHSSGPTKARCHRPRRLNRTKSRQSRCLRETNHEPFGPHMACANWRHHRLSGWVTPWRPVAVLGVCPPR